MDGPLLPREVVEDDDFAPAAVPGAVSAADAGWVLDDRGLPALNAEPGDPDDVVESFLPGAYDRNLEADEVDAAAQALAAGSQAAPVPHAHFPPLGVDPVDEFSLDGIASLAFPTLFPFGTGDPTSRVRLRKVEETDAVSWLLRYRDRRFAQHARFIFFMYNRILRHQALGQARFYIRSHPNDAHLTRAELKRKLDSAQGGVLLSRISRYVANIKASPAWWSRRKQEVDALFEAKGPPTVFFTFRYGVLVPVGGFVWWS